MNDPIEERSIKPNGTPLQQHKSKTIAVKVAVCLTVAAAFNSSSAFAIYGGKQTSQWPGMGAIVANGSNSPVCGATLISPHWVMSAAYCFAFGSQFKYAIANDLTSIAPGAVQLYTPDIIIIDPNYSIDDAPPVVHDHALLHFASPIPAMPFRVNDDSTAYNANVVAWVVGYGNSSVPGLKKIGEYGQILGDTDLFDPAGASVPDQPADEDFGDPWYIQRSDGFPLIVGLVTAPDLVHSITYSIPTLGEIDFIKSYVTDACLTSTQGLPCEGIFRNDLEAPPIPQGSDP